MATSFYKSGNVWVYTDGITDAVKTAPSGNYRRIVSGTKVGIVGVDNDFSLFEPQLIEVTAIEKSSTPGDTYTDIAEFSSETEDFFVSASGGGGTTRATFVPTSSPFANTTARDSWATSNLTELFNNASQVTVVTVDTGSEVFVYEWGGIDTPSSAPPSIGNFWILRVRSTMDALSNSILNWNFSNSTAGTDPGSTFLAFNNALKDNTTTINFNIVSNVGNAQFGGFLSTLNIDSYIFVRERTALSTNILYRVNGTPTIDSTRVDVPVTRVTDQGGEFTNSAVLDVTFLAGASGLLESLQSITTNTIPLKSSSSDFGDSSVTETPTQVISSKEIVAPSVVTNTGSLRLDDSNTISSNSRVIEIKDEARDQNQQAVVSKYDFTASEVPEYYDLSASSSFMLQTLSDENATSFNVTVTVQTVSGRDGLKFHQVIVIPHASGDGTFSMRYSNDTGVVIQTETTFTALPGDVGNQTTFDLENPIDVLNGESIYVSYSGVALRGHTYTSDPTYGTGFWPFVTTMGCNFEAKNLATEEFVNAHSGNITTDERNKLSGIESGAEVNVQADWNATNPANDDFILNKPTIPVARTDEEIQDLMNTTLVEGNNIVITYDDVAGTITITSTGAGGTTPTPVSTDLRYGLSSESDPALVDFGSLTDVASPTDPQTVSTGTTTAGQYFHIFSANTHDIQTITDTVLSQIVYQDGGTGNIFTKQSDARTEGIVTYDSYTIGPLNAGVDEEYILTFI